MKFSVLFALILIFSQYACAFGTEPEAHHGVLDLKSWNMDLDPVIRLKGEWLRYPGQLLSLDELYRVPAPEKYRFPLKPMDCPWTAFSDGVAERSDVAQCVSTYVLELRNIPTNALALMIPELSTAFQLSWNGHVIARGGAVSDQPALFKPYFGHRITRLKQDKGEGILVLQVANLLGAQGPERQLLLGDASVLASDYSRGELLEALAASIAGIGCILLLIQQKARHRYEKGLWGLGLVSFAALVYIITESFSVISWFFNTLSWEEVLRLNLLSQNLFIPGLVFWLVGRFGRVFPPWFLITTRLQLLLFVPLLMVLPESILIAVETPQMLINVFLGVVGFVCLIFFRRGESAALVRGAGSDVVGNLRSQRGFNTLLLTLLLLLIPATHDAFIHLQILHGMYWLPMGLAGFIVSQIFLLAVQRARQHAYLDGLNQEIAIRKGAMEEEVELLAQLLSEKVEQLEDVTSELRYLEEHDGLTGLLRQSEFFHKGRAQLTGAAKEAACASLILLDLDRYKHVGALYGPSAADQGMKEIAFLLSRWIEGRGLSARLEGESFALLVLGMSEDEALQEAEFLRLRISQRAVFIDDVAQASQQFHITASFGVCSVKLPHADITEMMNNAELALNRAKANGRNCVVSCSQLIRRPVTGAD